MSKIIREERGIPGHHFDAGMCHFRRHTHIAYGDQHFLVTTVGERWDPTYECVIGLDAHPASHVYETKVWLPKAHGNYRYWPDVAREVIVHGPEDSLLGKEHTAKDADHMHEEYVRFLSLYLEAGEELENNGFCHIFKSERIEHAN